MTDARAIAAKLTKAQREAIIGAHVVEGQSIWRNGRLAVRAHGKVLWNLCVPHMLVNDYVGTPLLTDLGLAVRAILQEQSQ